MSLTFEHHAWSENLRSMLLSAYSNKGEAFGDSVARACAWELGDTVASLRSREKAVVMLDEAANAVLARIPMPELKQEPPRIPEGMMLVAIPRTPVQTEALITLIRNHFPTEKRGVVRRWFAMQRGQQ